MPTVEFRNATQPDLQAIVELLAGDVLGASREAATTPLPAAYLHAFRAIDADPNQQLLLAELNGHIASVLQLSFIPGLSHQGSWRAQIEGVRVASAHRAAGVGRQLLAEAIARARAHGCRIVQLTTERSRHDAQRFYESLGFVASHAGMKLQLPTD
jgi:ribosomal protein S18 acetylase RimI-like enzyme